MGNDPGLQARQIYTLLGFLRKFNMNSTHPVMEGKSTKWHKVEGNAFNTWLCCLQMCDTSVRHARSGATAHYRAWMKWHQGAIRSKSSSQFPEMPVIMLYFTKTLQMFQWRIQEKTGENLRKELDINCTGIEKQPKVRPKSQNHGKSKHNFHVVTWLLFTPRVKLSNICYLIPVMHISEVRWTPLNHFTSVEPPWPLF